MHTTFIYGQESENCGFVYFQQKNKNWNVEKGPGKTCHFFFFSFFKYAETSFFLLIKFIGQWIPDGDRQEIARDIKKNISIFKTQHKMVTKFGQFKKPKCREGSQLCKLSQRYYHFLSSFEKDNNFFWYP